MMEIFKLKVFRVGALETSLEHSIETELLFLRD